MGVRGSSSLIILGPFQCNISIPQRVWGCSYRLIMTAQCSNDSPCQRFCSARSGNPKFNPKILLCGLHTLDIANSQLQEQMMKIENHRNEVA